MMSFHRIVKRGLKASLYAGLGALLVMLAGFVLYLEGRSDLEVWHLVELEEDFNADSELQNFAQYLALEDRLFSELDRKVYRVTDRQAPQLINRYSRDSLSDPGRWPRNWNRTFELAAQSPRAGVLLLHGMSDSPYSLRGIGDTLHAAGAHVVGLRLPGHGTSPSGLLELRWQDMAAAVRLAVEYLATKSGEKPLYIVGYSTGAALAVHYALSTLDPAQGPTVDRLVLLSPAIGVSPFAALAVWQSRVGHLLGLEKLQWNAILPEYDPFKYGSFAVNAGDAVYLLSAEVQRLLKALANQGRLHQIPPILAFQSVVDATVSTPALIDGLFARLQGTEDELVLFDINRNAAIEPILTRQTGPVIDNLLADAERGFRLTVVTNRDATSRAVLARNSVADAGEVAGHELGLVWPQGVYSLSHVALPFAESDPLYGNLPAQRNDRIHLGNLALRGERGVLQIPPGDMLRLRWNPFYPYLEQKMLAFLDLAE
jgi:alpha-beta hydrolase superfamily lysophospholipase